MEKLLINILNQYPLSLESIVVEKELNPQSWYNDKHYKIFVNNYDYSARFISMQRSNNEFFGELSDEIIEDQIKFTEFLGENNIPFMQVVKTKKNDRFLSVLIDNRTYRFILFKWIDRIHISTFNDSIAEVDGEMEAKFHSTSAEYAKAHTSQFDFIIQSDMNPLNIIWSKDDLCIKGIIDFESITYVDRTRGISLVN
ncbi:hypothetical protein [Gottfriedia acidiceleris]|uniref:hypothetical protein n=1 Tax=Gottfriedia acidiceleris TaxID=371036 RepID=UPI00101C7784|nr:hypothetical protein [Gottfriedia acidiceleris]